VRRRVRTILLLTLKDLRRRLADRLALALNLAIPLAIAGTMALVFGSRPGEEPQAPKLRLVVADLDGTPATGIITGASQNQEAAKHLDVSVAATREEGLSHMRDEHFAALVVIPKGFSDAMLSGRQATFEVVKNPAESVMPLVAEQGAGIAALYLSTGRRLLGDDSKTLAAMLQGDDWQDSAAIAALATTMYARVHGAGNWLFPPIIGVKTEQKAAGGTNGFNFIAWMYPGLIVMGLLYVALMQMRDLLRERRSGTLRRQLVAPVSVAAVAVSMVLLLAAGALAFHIDWGAPLPLLATAAAIVFTTTGFAALLYSLVTTERQGEAFGGILVMVMSLLGGSFVPPQVLPGWLQSISRFTVSHWAHDALRWIVAGGGWSDIAQDLLVLAVLGATFIGIGWAGLSRRYARGAL